MEIGSGLACLVLWLIGHVHLVTVHQLILVYILGIIHYYDVLWMGPEITTKVTSRWISR